MVRKEWPWQLSSSPYFFLNNTPKPLLQMNTLLMNYGSNQPKTLDCRSSLPDTLDYGSSWLNTLNCGLSPPKMLDFGSSWPKIWVTEWVRAWNRCVTRKTGCRNGWEWWPDQKAGPITRWKQQTCSKLMTTKSEESGMSSWYILTMIM